MEFRPEEGEAVDLGHGSSEGCQDQCKHSDVVLTLLNLTFFSDLSIEMFLIKISLRKCVAQEMWNNKGGPRQH